MPDKNTDWTADKSFWDEGWNDMEHRLDRQRRRRFLLPLLLCLLLAGAGALVLYNLPPEASPADGPAPVARPYADAPATNGPAPAAAPGPARAATPGTDRSPQPLNPAASGSATARRTTSPGLFRSGMAPAAPAPVSGEATSPTPPAPSGSAPEPVTKLALIVEPLPLAPLAALSVNPELPEVRLSTPADPLVPASAHSRYFLAAGTQVYPGSFLPGSYGMVERRFGRGDWFFPVALRYDYARRGVKSSPGDELALEYVSYNPTTANGSVMAYQVALDESLTVTTHSASLRAGAGRYVIPRLSLSAGGEYTYLLAGTGPAVNLNERDGAVVAAPATADFFDLNGVRQADLNAVASGVPRAGDYSVHTVNRSLLSAWLRADYRLSGHLNLTLGYTRHLTPLYRDGDLRVEGSRLELGLLYGF
ncbi:hypothetical protein [Lewinella sp. IMCC34183]|uniref:hypothetical protein n=1 Tax=Lewinella sp. IMCC34183 TaxID=2248762 RepID=UPI0013003D78|nr:hypothetical protein [Lewinella sp. IMCC34183]